MVLLSPVEPEVCCLCCSTGWLDSGSLVQCLCARATHMSVSDALPYAVSPLCSQSSLSHPLQRICAPPMCFSIPLALRPTSLFSFVPFFFYLILFVSFPFQPRVASRNRARNFAPYTGIHGIYIYIIWFRLRCPFLLVLCILYICD